MPRLSRHGLFHARHRIRSFVVRYENIASLTPETTFIYSVARRTHEIGIRLALGAQTSTVLKLALGYRLKLVVVGTLIGLAVAFGLTRLMSSLLFGVSPTDPVTFAGISVILISVAPLASYIPARRATKVDPMVALR